MADKLHLWRQKLLDVGKRNKLLNFKETKRSTLKIISPKTNELFNEILAGKVLNFPIIEQETLLQDDKEIYRTKGTLQSNKSGNELSKSLYQLRLRSRTAQEELGTNILYLAFGFLEWTEAEYSDEILKSPILLVPVELKKESILTPYTLTLFEDDIVINPTLCYKLETDFGVKIEYDIDADDFGLKDLFEYFTRKVKNQNWTVNTDVQLSLLSFLKLNMYKDLELNESKIMDNEIVKALCGIENRIETIPSEIVQANNLDKIITPINSFQVVDADSSQVQAILAAKRGNSFVLQGPPGTGKSQTITNIIAESLASGKKVLFVSEKLAALEVVYRNLERVKLQDFCLQLHSHKAQKALVVKELAETLSKPRTQINDEAINSLNYLENEIYSLNKYDSALHEFRQPLGKSVYQIHGEIEKYFKYPDIQYKINKVNEITIKEINTITEIIKNYVSCLTKVGGNYQKNNFYGFSKTPVTFELQKDIAQHFSVFAQTLAESIYIIQEARDIFSLRNYNSFGQLKELGSLLEKIIPTPVCPGEWLLKDDIDDIETRLQKVKKHYQTIIEMENLIFPIYEKDILEINAAGMLRQFKGEYSSIFRIFNGDYVKDKNTLKGYIKLENYKLNYKKALAHLELIRRIQELEADIVSDEYILSEWLDEYYKNRNTDWEYLFGAFKWISEIRTLYGIKNITLDFGKSICGKESSTRASTLRRRLEDKQTTLATELDFIGPLFDPAQYSIVSDTIQEVQKKFSNCFNDIDYLLDWVDFLDARNAGIEKGLINFFEEVEAKNIPGDKWVGIMLKRIYLLWLDGVYQKEEILVGFRKEKFDRLVADFQRKDRDQFTIAQARIRQKLSAERPDAAGFTSRGTEIHILLREAEKRRKILPLRKLFERIPNLLTAIKPCMLMSPLSVSLFLNPELYEFDTIIFDEASQVCTENAIGAIYRGKQLIVVGDREQLPPTNFFNASSSDEYYDNDEEDEDDIGAYESILDECGSILNRLPLLWHYRSRHEHLIAYSNAKIYKNLITFPTPIDNDDKDLGVEFIHVPNGIYERSTSRTNRIEAQRVAEAILDHFDRHPERSLGIVTFSEAQQEAIDNEISLLRKAKPQYENFFDEDKKEAFFVKSLENVQGDERDTIIFSIGYGKDPQGKMSMFFGPLNREGGYRRLNVAITRAKYNVKLVSSILPSDIDLSRTESRGVQMLRGYMDFAIRGMEAIIGELTIPDTVQFDSEFEMQVYDELRNHGLEVDTQVGCSGYRIDLAIRNPYAPGRYVIAIECDGRTYHSARTARERDRLREDVLKLRGWKIYRIWSTDWVRHRPLALEHLLNAIKEAMEDYKKDDGNGTLPDAETIEDPDIDQMETIVARKNRERYFETYKPTIIKPAQITNSQASYLYLGDQISKIVEKESPVHKETVCRYIAPLLRREKVTKKVTEIVDYIIRNYCKGKFKIKGDFFWSNNMNNPVFRIPGSGCAPRAIKLIAPEEIEEGMKLIVKRATGIEKNALFQEVSRALGYERTGEKITTIFKLAFTRLLRSGEVEVNGDIVSITARRFSS